MPLLPLLAATSSSVTGLPFYASAALASLTASAAAALGLDRWLAPRAGARQSLWAVALVWSSPCALVLQTPYAEALGLVLTAAALGLADEIVKNMLAFKTIGLFILTALAEIVGCYLPWLWLREGKSAWLLLPAAVSLSLFA